MVKFEKFAEKLTATQSITHIIWNVKFVTKNKKFSHHVYDGGIKNNYLEEPFFSLNIMLRLDLNPLKSISI